MSQEHVSNVAKTGETQVDEQVRGGADATEAPESNDKASEVAGGESTPDIEPEGPQVPELTRLHERHGGLTQPLSESYAEAAAVCLSRHHASPILLKVGTDEQTGTEYGLRWPAVTELQERAWANTDDATRDGAYSVALATAECHLGLSGTTSSLAECWMTWSGRW